jgi:hypothetical protein
MVSLEKDSAHYQTLAWLLTPEAYAINEQAPTSEVCGGMITYSNEVVWVARGKKLITFDHTFVPSDCEDQNRQMFEELSLGELLGLWLVEREFVHYASKNNTKHPEGTPIDMVELAWYRGDSDSLRTIELYKLVRELDEAKELYNDSNPSAGLRHILYGLFAGYTIEQIKAHNQRRYGKLCEDDKQLIRAFHPALEVFTQ